MVKKAVDKTDAPLKFPIYLDKEDDSVEHLRYLGARREAYDTLHRQVLAFLLPAQTEEANMRRKWWNRIMAKYKIPDGTAITVAGLEGGFPRLEQVEEKEEGLVND